LGKLSLASVDLAVQLASAQQLEHDVKGVIGLEYPFEFDNVGVIDGPHHFYLI
jgi:hypothetical protein